MVSIQKNTLIVYLPPFCSFYSRLINEYYLREEDRGQPKADRLNDEGWWEDFNPRR